MLSWAISEAIFFLCPGLVTPMAVRSCPPEQCCQPLLCPRDSLLTPAPPSPVGAYLGCHATDGGHVVAGLQEVGGVALQLELAQPVIDGLRVLGWGGSGPSYWSPD